MNITLKISTVNLKNRLPQEVRAFSAEELKELMTQGIVIKKKKWYLLIIHHRQFTIECPILRRNDGSYQMIWPSFKLPNRPYPVFVYLNLEDTSSLRLALGAIEKELFTMLNENKSLPRKQQLTAKTMWKELTKKGFVVGESTIRRHVRSLVQYNLTYI